MKKMLPFFLLLFSVASYCQTSPDLKAIQQNVTDSSSPYFFNKLSYQFRLDPTMPDSIGIQHLYYGKLYSGNSISPYDKELMGAMDQLQKNNYDKAIEAAEKLITKDPANLKLLGILIQAYAKKDPNSMQYDLYRYQVKRLLDCIVTSGNGQTESTAYYVSSVSDSYILMDILGKNPFSFKRASHSVADGMMDVYKKKKETVHITVVYNRTD